MPWLWGSGVRYALHLTRVLGVWVVRSVLFRRRSIQGRAAHPAKLMTYGIIVPAPGTWSESPLNGHFGFSAYRFWARENIRSLNRPCLERTCRRMTGALRLQFAQQVQ